MAWRRFAAVIENGLIFCNTDPIDVLRANADQVMAAGEPNPYKDVQSLVRGFRIIEALSEVGWTRVGELSRLAEIQRSSAYRIVNTLEQLGYVSRREEDGAIGLSPKFAYLADSLKNDDIVSQFAWPALFDLTAEILWPSDFASLEGGRVLIRLTTHKISPMSIHRGMVGKERHLVRSALGQAILSAMDDDELESTLSIVDGLAGENAHDVRDRDAVRRIVDAVRSRGYADSTGQTESKISAIAVPVRSPDGRVAGAINIVFFRSVMSTEGAAARHLERLRACVDKVETALRDFAERRAVGIE